MYGPMVTENMEKVLFIKYIVIGIKIKFASRSILQRSYLILTA